MAPDLPLPHARALPECDPDPLKPCPRPSLVRHLPAELHPHAVALTAAAQKVYDAWEQDADGLDPELGEGGICQDIAEEMAGVLNHAGIEAGTVDNNGVGEQHVWVVAKLPSGVWNVDIPPHHYERGGGYSWRKIPDVTLDPTHLLAVRLDPNPEAFESYLGS